MLQTPVDFTWKIVPYNGYHDDLILCDLDEMRGVTLPEQEPGTVLPLVHTSYPLPRFSPARPVRSKNKAPRS